MATVPVQIRGLLVCLMKIVESPPRYYRMKPVAGGWWPVAGGWWSELMATGDNQWSLDSSSVRSSMGN